jgi:L-ribulose-5-phosphate 4-epimerase
MASPAEVRRLKQQVADSSRILDHQGLVDYHGHVSARIPGTNSLVIKPVLRAHNQIRPRDILVVDMDAYMAADKSQWSPDQQKGRVINAPVPPRETMLHVAIMQARPDVNSVVHTHQLVATAVGVGGQPIKAWYNQGLPFAPETPIFPRANLITTLADGNAVAECLGERTAALLKGHGVVVVGESVDHAVSNTIYLERTALMQVIASIVGDPEALDPAYVEEFGKDWNRRAPHAYEYFRSLVPSLAKGAKDRD